MTVETYTGTTKQTSAVFPVKTEPPAPAPQPAPVAAKYYFVSPPKPGTVRPGQPAQPPFTVQPVPPTPVRRPGL